MYRLVRPITDFALLGTRVRLDSHAWYLSVPASNQPNPNDKLFIIYAENGNWEIERDDVEYCLGFLLQHEEVEFADEEELEDLEEALEELYQKNSQ